MMATVTRLPRPVARVWELADVDESVRAKGGSKGRTDATRRSRALSCPWRVYARSGASRASWARPGTCRTGQCRRLLVLGVYQRDQESEGDLQDTMEVRGEGRGDEWHGGWHEVTA